jgi:endoglycosylceramidase
MVRAACLAGVLLLVVSSGAARAQNPNCPPPFAGAKNWSCPSGTQTGGRNMRGVPSPQQSDGGVYCQDWPGHSSRPHYPGTGPQTPCGLPRGGAATNRSPDQRADQTNCWAGLPDGKLCTEGTAFKNGHGETVILRGVNLAGSSKIPPFLPLPKRGSPRGPAPSFNPLSFDFVANTDFSGLDDLPKWGVNVIRLLFVWEAYEPEKGRRTQSYLDMLRRIAEEAWSRGMYTIIDFHQDAFARWLAKGCGEGLPRWTLQIGLPRDPYDEPDNSARCGSWMQNAILDDRVARAFDALYEEPQLRGAYLQLMRDLAGSFQRVPGVIGYDVLNEPFSRLSRPLFGGIEIPFNPLVNAADQDTEWHEKQLSDFYRATYNAIRQVDPKGILFLEPNLNVDPGIQTDLSAPCANCNIVYAPHYYDLAIVLPTAQTIGYLSSARLEKAFQNMRAVSARWNAPLFLGEFGAVASVARVAKYMNDFHGQLNASFASAAQWSYTPAWTPQAKDGWNGEDLSIVDDGRNPDGSRHYRAQLFFPRPYPQSISGNPVSLAVDAAERSFSLDFAWLSQTTDTNETVIYVPQLDSIRALAQTQQARPAPGSSGLDCLATLNPVLAGRDPNFLETTQVCLGLGAGGGTAAAGGAIQTRGPVRCGFETVRVNRAVGNSAPGSSAVPRRDPRNEMTRVTCVALEAGARVGVTIRAGN